MKPKYLPVLLFLLLYSSCTVYREYQIEVYKPGELLIPPKIENAAVVYRNFKYTGDTLQNYFKDDSQLKKAQTPVNIDSLLISTCLNELAFNLKNNNTFSEVPVFPYNTFERHTGENLPDLSATLVSRLTKDANAGLLITLETYSSFFSTFPATFGTPQTNEVISVAVWGIYNPQNGSLIERKTMIDTIYWNGYNEEGDPQQNYNPPPRLKALELASVMAGENFAKRFYASWQTEKRMYSVPPLPDFSDAAFFLEEGKWDEAIALWRKYTDDRNGKMAIEARYNLALAYEMKDDLEAAEKWLAAASKLAQSYRSKSNIQMIQLYQKALDKRQRDILILEQIDHENKP